MKISLIITTINNYNKNIKLFENGCKKNNWQFIVIADKKTPNNFKLKYGDLYKFNLQKKLNLNLAKICPENNYSRKNIGYLMSLSNNADFIIETDDDNIPKKQFFSKISLIHKTKLIKNESWINIYDLFVKNKKEKIWPRGLPLDEIFVNKLKISNNTIKKKFFLQQGVVELNPDVDAIYRLLNKKIYIKFKNKKISLGKALSTFNSQCTIWHKSISILMYLPSTCSMRCTDIWRSLITLYILKINKLDILFFGTTMFQKRNLHDLMKDFNEEIPMYINNKLICKFK